MLQSAHPIHSKQSAHRFVYGTAAYLLMLPPEYQIACSLNPRFWEREKLHGKVRKPKGLRNIPSTLIGSRRTPSRVTLSSVHQHHITFHIRDSTHLTIRVYCPRKCFCQPVERNRFENGRRRKGLVDPVKVFLANPEIPSDATAFESVLTANIPCQQGHRV